MPSMFSIIYSTKEMLTFTSKSIAQTLVTFFNSNSSFLSIDDPLKKNATIGFINNFGQIPKQLFKKAHPSKKMAGLRHSVIDPTPMLSAASVPFEKMFFHNLDNLKPSPQPVKGEKFQQL